MAPPKSLVLGSANYLHVGPLNWYLEAEAELLSRTVTTCHHSGTDLTQNQDGTSVTPDLTSDQNINPTTGRDENPDATLNVTMLHLGRGGPRQQFRIGISVTPTPQSLPI